MSNLSHVDQGALDRLTEWGGDKLLRQMIRLFLENAKERVDQIDAGLSNEEIDSVERGAHSLKSSAANVGAREVNRIASEMEDAAERSDWDVIRPLRAELTSAMDAATSELTRFLEGLPE